MKRIKKLEPSINPVTFKDGRGIIATYLPERLDIKEWNYIVTLVGATRGKHYHLEFDEYIMVVEGSGVYVELTDGNELPTMVATGDCIYIPSGVPHTYYPTADTKVIALITKRWDDCAEPITRIDG